ncbi:hypothetical protein BC628DRAFT_1142713 [Trametes gibbosa]|nr:hypothetical protein BC628DRAFT_1142713 [Trametes gibbosa]
MQRLPKALLRLLAFAAHRSLYTLGSVGHETKKRGIPLGGQLSSVLAEYRRPRPSECAEIVIFLRFHVRCHRNMHVVSARMSRLHRDDQAPASSAQALQLAQTQHRLPTNTRSGPTHTSFFHPTEPLRAPQHSLPAVLYCIPSPSLRRRAPVVFRIGRSSCQDPRHPHLTPPDPHRRFFA